MIAFAMRIENWAQIVPYRISFVGQTEGRLKKDICARLEKPHRLEGIEAAFQPLDVSVVRAALFEFVVFLSFRHFLPSKVSRYLS